MRLAHISDLHLRYHLPGTAEIPTRLSRLMPDTFARALDEIQAHRPDVLVLSGDLLDFPFEGMNDPVLQSAGLADLQLIADLLAPLPMPQLVIPGNHDHPALVEHVFPAGSGEITVKGYRILAFRDQEGPQHVPQRTGDERQRFRSALAGGHSLPQVHVQHYVVWPERNADYPHTYGEGAAMREAITASGNVRLVLSGHYHAGVPLFADKGVYFATIPAFTEAPHPYTIYDLEGDTVTGQTYRMSK
jgi:3',5'-cyclic AMP phosphodiesterase CpdA